MSVDQDMDRIIDAEIQDLIEFKRMAKNPKMLELMRRLVAASSNGGIPAKPVMVEAPAMPPHKNLTKPNGLSRKALAVVRDLKKGFSAVDLVNHLRSGGFVFVSKNPRSAIVAPLRKMLKKGIIRTAREGVGNQPTLYDYMGEKGEGT